MLPRMDGFKAALFTRRIISFNESFVPFGKTSKNSSEPLAILWHEGITGRNQEELTSTFHKFLLQNRDSSKITIWLDNCTSQNKNRCLLTFLV